MVMELGRMLLGRILMSKRSKVRRQRMEAERLARLVKDTPITGHFEDRVTEIVKTEGNGQQVGHVRVDSPKADPRLPAYYNNGHYATNVSPNWFRGQGVKADTTGYQTVDDDKTIFRITTTDITEGSCPIAKIPKVYVSNRLWSEWINLAEDYNTEWLAYLIGQFVRDDKGPRYEVRKMYFPPQTANGGHVDVDDDYTSYLPNTIGAIHSHVGMQVFFSAEDLRHSNWPVEIVVNRKGEAKVMIRHQLECGQWIKNYSDIITVGDASDSKYVAALDKAFASGEQLRLARVKSKQQAVGYRTPEPEVNTNKVAITTYEADKEWHFHINGKPHRWSNEKQQYMEVVKINGEWIDKEDHEANLANIVVSAEIDEATGQVVITKVNEDDGSQMAEAEVNVTRPATQAEIDKMLEAEVDDEIDRIRRESGEVDAASCLECGGTGKVDVTMADGVGQVECAICAGSGLKDSYRFPGGVGGIHARVT